MLEFLTSSYALIAAIPFLGMLAVMHRHQRDRMEIQKSLHAVELERLKVDHASLLLRERMNLEGYERKIGALENQLDLYALHDRLVKTPAPGIAALPPPNRLNPSGSNAEGREIPLNDAMDFYNAVAPFYNERNTANYHRVTQAVFDLAARHISLNYPYSMLDIGGGTGALLLRFRHTQVTRWVNLDFSSESLKVFRNTFSDQSVISDRCLDFHSPNALERGENFTLVIASFVWSSMPTDPDFSRLIPALGLSGVLIVADNHATYTSTHPKYGIVKPSGESIYISPRPLLPARILDHAAEQGFRHIESTFLTDETNAPYAQLHAFKVDYGDPSF